MAESHKKIRGPGHALTFFKIFAPVGRQIIAVCLTLIGFGFDDAFADKRVALVIGNSAYANAPRLVNPANDAKDVSAALKRIGFDVITGLDLDRSGMDSATIRFARAARDSDVAVFYYSGHAMQFAGANYLMPIDAKLSDEADLRLMVRADDVVSDLQQAKNLKILVLDSCRDNPLAAELKRSIGRTRSASVSDGLAKIESPQGMIVAYATQAGRTADDGAGRNSPYTTAFLRHIEEQNEIGAVFRRISADVYNSTNRSQLPELSLSLIGEIYLKGMPATNSSSDAEIAALQARLRSMEEQLRQKAANEAQPPDKLPENTRQQAALSSTGNSSPEQSSLQRVVLYEEDPNNAQGKQSIGKIIWRSGKDSRGFNVRGDLEIPDRKIKASLVFRRNEDKSLPASHTIEVQFNSEKDGGVSVANIPGLLVKQTEQTRGTPLAGLAVKVTDNYFLIGLSNVDKDKEKNIALLREKMWFDLPLVYENKKRAIIAIEKGAGGSDIFNSAFASWGE
ncbi:MAG: caspase family protein [Pseudomonadota bacterium]